MVFILVGEEVGVIVSDALDEALVDLDKVLSGAAAEAVVRGVAIELVEFLDVLVIVPVLAELLKAYRLVRVGLEVESVQA